MSIERGRSEERRRSKGPWTPRGSARDTLAPTTRLPPRRNVISPILAVPLSSSSSSYLFPLARLLLPHFLPATRFSSFFLSFSFHSPSQDSTILYIYIYIYAGRRGVWFLGKKVVVVMVVVEFAALERPRFETNNGQLSAYRVPGVIGGIN